MSKSAQAVYTAQFITLQKLKEQISGDEEYVLHTDYMRDVDALQSRLTRLEAAVREAFAIANEPHGVDLRVRETRIVNWKRQAQHALEEPQGGGE